MMKLISYLAATNQLTNILPGSNIPQVKANQSEIQVLLQLFFGVVGALALLFIIIGGFRYIISGGDPQAAAAGKKTIIYAAIGLVVAISGEAIVTWALGFV